MSGKPGRFLLFLFFLFPLLVQSQFKISGEISLESDVSENLDFDPLANVLIQVYSESGEIVVSAYTQKDGRFEFSLEKPGEYSIVVNDLDYESDWLSFAFTDKPPEPLLLKIQKKIVQLQEVFISKKSYEVKGDTIIFDARAYLDGSERVVEDLLKKIPGLEITQEGNILVNGKEVEKIMIEGDDFFEKGYKIVSKNMPVKPVSKVEVLNNYSHNHLLKGFEDSDKVALNLKLKEGAKNSWFGTAGVKGTFFPEDNYDLNLNLMSFGKNNKHYFLGNANDLGYDVTGGVEQLYRTNDVTIGDHLPNHYYLKSPFSVPYLDKSLYKMNKSETGSLNSIFTLSEKLKLKTKILGKWDKLNFYQNSLTDYYADEFFTNREEIKTKDKSFTLKAGLDWIYEINKNSNLDISSLFSANDFEKEQNSIFNEIHSQNRTPIESYHFDQKIKYTNRVNPRNVWAVNLRYLFQNNTENLYSDSDRPIFGNAFDSTLVYFLNQKIDRKLHYGALESKWIHKIAEGDFLEANFTVQNLNNFLKTNFLFSDENAMYEADDYQNDIRLNQTELGIQLKYNWKITKKLSWKNTVGIHYLLDGNTQFLYPKLNSSLNWKNEKNSVYLIYSLANSSLSYYDRFDGYIYKGERNFEKKFSENNLLPVSGFLLKYDYGRLYDNLNFGFELNYRYNSKYISRNYEINPELQFTNYQLLKGKEEFIGSAYGSYLFDKLNHYLKLTFLNNHSSYSDIIYSGLVDSGQPREIKRDMYNFGITINSAYRKSILNYSLSHQWSKNHFEINSSEFKQFNTQTSLDLNMRWGNRYFLNLNQQFYYFPELSESKTSYFVNASFSYEWKKYDISATLGFRNIFNNSIFKTSYITDYYQTQNSYKLFPRMVLLGMSFNF